MSLYGGISIPGKPDLDNIRRLDLLPMSMIHDMHRYGIAIDKDWFSSLSSRLATEMTGLKGEICSYIPVEKLEEFIAKSNLDADDEHLPMNVDSGPQIAKLLFDVLGVGEGRQLKRTKGGDRVSTGKKQLETLKRTHPLVQRILDYRERAKLKNTYTDTLPNVAKLHKTGSCWCGLKHWVDTWRVHTQFLSTRTDTGRFASKNPNLQNVSARSALGREVRKGFLASKNTKLVGADFSQIEMRIGAHYSQDTNLLRIFMEGLDPHTDTAKRAFNTDKPDKLSQRDPCKNVNFGVFFGLNAPGLYDLMAVTYATAGMEMPDWLDQQWCSQFIEDWFQLYPGVREYLEQQYYRARRYGIVWTLFGRVRRVPEVYSVHKHIRSAGLRQAGNLPIQGSAADIMKLAMASIDKNLKELRSQGVWAYPLLTIHDELQVEVEDDYAEFVRDMMCSEMMSVMTDTVTDKWHFRVPIMAEGKVSDRWEK